MVTSLQIGQVSTVELANLLRELRIEPFQCWLELLREESTLASNNVARGLWLFRRIQTLDIPGRRGGSFCVNP